MGNTVIGDYFCGMRISLFLMGVFYTALVFAQDGTDPNWPLGNTFRTASNPLYWKNKKPYEGYWQQDVYYKISATLNDSTEVITGNEVLVYYNNSPNTITEAFFHLYQNAVQPGSLVDELYTENKTTHVFGRYEAQGKGTEILNCTVNGKETPVSIKNTVMRIPLTSSLAPGDSVVFGFNFKTYFDRGTIRRRMKVYDHDGFKHFNGVHWYPRICVYDRKFTWETAQHMEHEFYGDYGSFDVELSLPNEYVNEATGVLLNPEETYPGSLRLKLDISNYKVPLKDNKPGLVAPRTGKLKTWRYHADNVHDFAWTADPTYRIGEVTWNGIKCIALVQEQNAWRWQPTAELVAQVIAIYSRDFGMYEYPKMVAADAADGMEYPMLTLDGGIFPSHRGLIAHEVGHNWFFGMVGNNETYRAALDEGFTQFLTAWSMKILTNQTQRPSDVEYNTNYFGYLRDAIDGTDPTLNTHSDDFNNALGHGGGYGHVYYKTATMLYNLEYVLGDSVFKDAMQHYVKQWKICHPYIEDFRNSIIMRTKTDLNWFFDQWFETSKYIDYSVKKVKKDGEGKYKITIERKGDMIMPVDLKLSLANGEKVDFTIPVSHYNKPGSLHPADPWIGWGKLRKTYTFGLSTSAAIKQLEIDPSGRLADIDQRNNVWKRKPNLSLDRENGLSRDNRGGYELHWRPDVWYSYINGVRGGIKVSGDYAARKHIFNLYVWGQSPDGKLVTNASSRVTYWFDYRNFMRKNGELVLGSRYISNVWIHQGGWEKFVGKGRFSTSIKFMRRDYSPEMYLPSPGYLVQINGFLPQQNNWSAGRNNISANVGYLRPYARYKNSGSLDLKFRASTPWSDYSYGYVSATWINNYKLGKTTFRTRLFGMAGQGSNSPSESMLYAAGANPEDVQDNKVVRDWSTFPIGTDDLNKYINLGGGLNLRGFTGYALPHTFKDSIRTFYRGNNGVSINGEWDISGLFEKIPKFKMASFNLYLFGDAGIIAYPAGGQLVNSGVLADAGAGIMLNLQNWNQLLPKSKRQNLTAVAPFRIRLDMPVFVSAVQEGDENVKFRWMLSINRAF